MKVVNNNFLLFLIISITISSIHAQKIESDDVFQLNTKVVMEFNGDTTVDITKTGMNQSWDVSGFLSHDTIEIFLQDPTLHNESSQFPSANAVLDERNASYKRFFVKDQNELRDKGVYLSSGNIQRSDYRWLKFPLQFGDSFDDTYQLKSSNLVQFNFDPDSSGPHPYVDSVLMFRYVKVTWMADATGEVITQYDTIKNCIRLKQELTYYDTLKMRAGNSWKFVSGLVWDSVSKLPQIQDSIAIRFQSGRYSWWSENSQYAVLLAYDGGSTQTIQWITSEESDYTGINDENEKLSLKIYPNPNKGSFLIEDAIPGPYEILNIDGKTVMWLNLIEGRNSIDIELKPGTYFVRPRNVNSIEAKRILIQ